jgi:hypothetical protein
MCLLPTHREIPYVEKSGTGAERGWRINAKHVRREAMIVNIAKTRKTQSSKHVTRREIIAIKTGTSPIKEAPTKKINDGWRYSLPSQRNVNMKINQDSQPHLRTTTEKRSKS